MWRGLLLNILARIKSGELSCSPSYKKMNTELCPSIPYKECGLEGSPFLLSTQRLVGRSCDYQGKVDLQESSYFEPKQEGKGQGEYYPEENRSSGVGQVCTQRTKACSCLPLVMVTKVWRATSTFQAMSADKGAMQCRELMGCLCSCTFPTPPR